MLYYGYVVFMHLSFWVIWVWQQLKKLRGLNMNSLIIKLVLVGLLLGSSTGLYFMIKKNGELSEENKNLTATVEDTRNAIFSLGKTITGLQVKYAKAESDEFNKFNKTDINKIHMAKLVTSYNAGIKRVLKDYQNRTAQFVGVTPETTSP